jgi:hypothetical protein
MEQLGNNYEWALPYVDTYLTQNEIQIGSIAEIGSRDALDGMALAKRFNPLCQASCPTNPN